MAFDFLLRANRKRGKGNNSVLGRSTELCPSQLCMDIGHSSVDLSGTEFLKIILNIANIADIGAEISIKC